MSSNSASLQPNPKTIKAELHAENLELRLNSLRQSAKAAHEKLVTENLNLSDRCGQLREDLDSTRQAVAELQDEISFHTARRRFEQRIMERLVAFYSASETGCVGEPAGDDLSFEAMLSSSDLVSHKNLRHARAEALALTESAAHSTSVIMPTYNRATSIERAIRSALEQSVPVKEVIVADDASTDNTLRLLHETFPDQIASGQLVVLPCEKGGVCAMRNTAMAAASGDTIAFLDSDNFWHPDHILWALAGLETGQADAVYTGTNIHHLTENWSRTNCAPYDRKKLLSQNFIDLNCFVHRMSLYAMYGGFDTDLTRLVDWDYIIRLTRQAAPLRIPVATVEYFLDKESLGNISFVQSLDENAVKIQLKHIVELEKFGILTAGLKKRLEAASNTQTVVPDIPAQPPLREPVSLPQSPAVAQQQVRLPYLGGIRLFVVLPDGASPPPGLPTGFVRPRFIYLQGGGHWSDAVAHQGAPLDDSCLPEGNYWVPDLRQPLPTAHQLATLTAATELTMIDLAVGSSSLETGPSVAGKCFRNQVVLRDTQIENFVFGKSFGAEVRGKVLRIPDSPRPEDHKRDLSVLFGQDVRFEDKNQYFTFGADPGPAPVRPEPNLRQAPSDSTKPRILVLAQKLAVGGVERNTIEITRQLRDSHDCIYLTLEKIYPEQGSVGYQATEVCLNTIDLAEVGHHGIYPELLSTLNAIYTPDALWICNGSMWLAANALKVRAIFDNCGIVDQQVYDVDAGWINRYQEEGIQSFDRFIAINRKIYDKFITVFGMDPDRVDLIYSAINARRFRDARAQNIDIRKGREAYGLPLDKKLFVFMGRLVDQKRPLDFLKVAQLSALQKDQHFVLVGDGMDAPEVEAFLTERALSNVTWIKNVADTTQFWPLVDAYLVTSQFEGLPIALLEAISLGVPVVATDVGDIRYVVDKYNAGYIVDHAKDPDLFSRILQDNLTGLEDCARTLAPKGDEIIEFFSAENIARQFSESFEKSWQTHVEKTD